MDNAEEELRKKLMLLERSVFDPALNGRGEEIWARMVSVRERGRQLQREFEKAGRGIGQDKGVVIDEEVMRRVKKVCLTCCDCKFWVSRDANKSTDLGRLQFPTWATDE